MGKNRKFAPVMFEPIESRILMSAAGLPDMDDPGLPVTSPPAVNMLVVTQQPTTATVGQPLGQITVEIFDVSGTLATDDDSNVTLSGDAVTGTTTVAANNGAAVFNNLVINTTGNEILTASDTGLSSVTTQPIAVRNTVKAGQRFAPFTVDPSANAKWVKVKLVDPLSGKIALTKTLFPRHGQPITVNNLTAFIAGDYDMVAADSLGGSEALQQVTVLPSAPHALWFSSQPRVLDADAVVTVSVLDQYGNLTTQADGSDLILHSWLPKGTPGPAPILSGNVTATLVNGSATFTGLTMDQPGHAHLIARLGNLKPTVSNVFQAGATLNLWPGNGVLL